MNADGTLHISSLTLPQSDYLSAEFKQAYVERVAMMSAFPHPPAMDAPKAQWDQFDADVDRMLAGALAWNLKQYPTTMLDTTIAGVRVGIVTPKDGVADNNQQRVLINLHGGGFFTGRGLVKGQIESIPIAALAQIKVITLDYRQAPYHNYPAATEDVEAVYRTLLQQYKPQAIGIFGCSAGGTLTSQAVAWFQAKGLPRPGAVGILCAAPVPYGAPPFGWSGDSLMWGAGGVPTATVLNEAAKVGAATLKPTGYMEGVDLNDPQAYPGTSSEVLAKFPPALLISGTRSGEMSAVIVAHARFLKLGVDSSLYIMEGGWHGSPVGDQGTPEGYDVSVYIARWFDQHLAR